MKILKKTKRDYLYNPETGHHEWVDTPIEKVIYDEEDKLKIVSEYYQGHEPAQKVIERYKLSSKQVLFSWMDKYLHEDFLNLPENQTEDTMAKKKPEEQIKELQAENKRLEQALKLETLRSKAYYTMITVAEQTFNIPIRKKSGTKQ